jgi:hypothetical protein
MNNFNIVNTNPNSVTTTVKKVQLTEVRTNEYKKRKSPVSCSIIKFR